MLNIIQKVLRAIGRSKLQHREVRGAIKPIIKLLEAYEIKKAEIEIAKIAIDICVRVENKTITPRDADLYFTFLFDAIDFHDIPLRQEVKELILEGNVLHDFGTEFGANLDRMKNLATKILREEITV